MDNLIKKFKNGNVTLHSPLKYDKSIADENDWIDTYYNDDMFMNDLVFWTDKNGQLYMIDNNKGKVYDVDYHLGFNECENALMLLQKRLTEFKSLKFTQVDFDTWMNVYDRYLEE